MPASSVSAQFAVRAVNQSAAETLTPGLLSETLYQILASIGWNNGTGDGAADRVAKISGTLTATTTTIDLLSSLTDIYGAAVSFVEVRAIIIRNTSTSAAKILKLGAGSNPAFAGLFGATGDIIIIPAVGPTGLPFVWSAGYDGGGLIPVAGTGDILTLDSGAQTVTYEGLIIGVSA